MKEIMRVAPLLLLLCVFVMQGQDMTKGSSAGVVRDPNGTVVPSATAKLASPYGGGTTKTSSVGEYSFKNLVHEQLKILPITLLCFHILKSILTIYWKT